MAPPANTLKSAKKFLKGVVCSYYSLALKTRKPYEHIHILSHMRSGSTLLTHLLISNPDVCGYGETHVAYDNQRALTMVTTKILYMLRLFPLPGNERFILDKTLHNHLLKQENIRFLSGEQSHVIFLIREPIGVVASLTGYLEFSNEAAINYYTSRLQAIELYVNELSKQKPCSAFTYDQIINNTKGTFSLLEKQLDLKTPLSENYQLVRTTGQKGIGDASSNIYRGTILRNRQKTDLPNLSDEELKYVWKAYNSCLRTLQEKCLMPLSEPQ